MCFGHCNFLTKNMENEKETKEEEEVLKKVVNGKEYIIHMPSDPAEENICDGCQ